MDREEADLAAAQYMAENAVLKQQVDWFRDMLGRAYALIGTGLDDEHLVEPWLQEYREEMT